MEESSDSQSAGASGAKKGKKLPWHQHIITNAPHSKIDYVSACCEALMQRMGPSEAPEIFKPGTVQLPSPLVSSVKCKSNGFPTLKVEQGIPPLDKAGDGGEPVVLKDGGVKYIYPHPSVSMRCSFCTKEIKTTEVKKALYDKQTPSPWFVCCEECCPIKDTIQ